MFLAAHKPLIFLIVLIPFSYSHLVFSFLMYLINKNTFLMYSWVLIIELDILIILIAIYCSPLLYLLIFAGVVYRK